jgi:predicted nucleic acid-binding protein
LAILHDQPSLPKVDHVIVEQAAILAPRELRSLDAIHLASALSLNKDLTDFVAYDPRLCSAAAKAGLPVVSPT